MNIVTRKEKKFIISIDNYYKFTNYISKILNEDYHNGHTGYTTRSLYFDSINDRDFEEKETGVDIRRKIRLRVYNLDDNYAKLELKRTQGENQIKQSIKISRDDAISLINCQYNVLLKYNDNLANECYGIMNMHLYRPKAIVEYKRKAFIANENSIRITLDNNIFATESNYNLFEKNIPMYPVLDIDNVILEVKYENFLLSYIKDILNYLDKSELSVSKYMLSRSISKNYSKR